MLTAVVLIVPPPDRVAGSLKVWASGPRANRPSWDGCLACWVSGQAVGALGRIGSLPGTGVLAELTTRVKFGAFRGLRPKCCVDRRIEYIHPACGLGLHTRLYTFRETQKVLCKSGDRGPHKPH